MRRINPVLHAICHNELYTTLAASAMPLPRRPSQRTRESHSERRGFGSHSTRCGAMRYEFHPEALNEYEDAARFYAGSQPGHKVTVMIREIAKAAEAIKTNRLAAPVIRSVTVDRGRFVEDDFWKTITA